MLPRDQHVMPWRIRRRGEEDLARTTSKRGCGEASRSATGTSSRVSRTSRALRPRSSWFKRWEPSASASLRMCRRVGTSGAVWLLRGAVLVSSTAADEFREFW